MSILVHNPFPKSKSQETIRQLIRCKRLFHGAPRLDWIATYDLADENLQERQGIDKYLFAQVHLFFEIRQKDKIFRLVYLEWFDVTDVPKVPGRRSTVPRDPETGMAITVRSNRFSIVSVDDIIRAVHMQPLFEELDSARRALSENMNMYSFQKYVLNKYADRLSWEEMF